MQLVNCLVKHTPVLSALCRLGQENGKFEASLGYRTRTCLKTKPSKQELKLVQIVSVGTVV